MILTAMTAFWFLGAILGCRIAWDAAEAGDTTALSPVLLYIGAPMSGGVVSYMIKSAGENKEKIRQTGWQERRNAE